MCSYDVLFWWNVWYIWTMSVSMSSYLCLSSALAAQWNISHHMAQLITLNGPNNSLSSDSFILGPHFSETAENIFETIRPPQSASLLYSRKYQWHITSQDVNVRPMRQRMWSWRVIVFSYNSHLKYLSVWTAIELQSRRQISDQFKQTCQGLCLWGEGNDLQLHICISQTKVHDTKGSTLNNREVALAINDSLFVVSIRPISKTSKQATVVRPKRSQTWH